VGRNRTPAGRIPGYCGCAIAIANFLDLVSVHRKKKAMRDRLQHLKGSEISIVIAAILPAPRLV
jgi:hypothetical protein